MNERRLEAMTLRKLASAALAFQAWLDGDAAPASSGGQAQEAHRQLRALSRPPSKSTLIYDSHGRVIRMTDPPAPADYSLRLADDGDLLVVTRTDVFVFVLDEWEVLHFVGRRPLGPGALDGDQPS
jgi:hypothetical protein